MSEIIKQVNLNSPSGAIFSKCRGYRYVLWRSWSSNPYALFIGLNPSTANETEDDPTIRRCKRFAQDWGYGAICMANLFAYRATQPADMKKHGSPVGIDNDVWLQDLARSADVIVCAWGVNGNHLNRDEHVKAVLQAHELKCLGVTKNGHPGHPLYIKADAPLATYRYANQNTQANG